MELEGKPFSSGTKVSDPGTLKLTVSDEAGNASTAEIKLTREDSQAPTVSVAIPEKNVIAGVTVTVKDNQLLFNEDIAASWKDDYTEACNVLLTLVSSVGSERTVNS